ncbi:MAG: hypothetical protein R2704_06980 [Microthrixaceae bacterium]
MTPAGPHPAGTGPAERPAADTTLRVLLKVLVWLGAAAWVLIVVPALTLFVAATGSLGVPWGWLIGIAVMTVPVVLFALALVAVGTRPSLTLSYAAAAGAIALIAGMLAASWSSAQPPLLRAELDQVGVPAGWVLTGESSKAGGCLDACSNVSRTYDAPGDPTAALELVVARFDDHGYRLDPIEPDGPLTGGSATEVSRTGRRPAAGMNLEVEADSVNGLTEVRLELEGT